jgi:hypothetical protein
VSTIIYAAIAAALILISRPPDLLPPENTLAVRLLGSEITEAVEFSQPRVLQFTEQDVNAHLASTLRNKGPSGIPGMEFKQAYAKLEPGVVRIALHQTLWGYSIYSGVGYRLSIREGKIDAQTVGGNFGRLAVHPKLMEYVSIAFKKLWTALSRERAQIEKMQAVRVEKGVIYFWTKGSAR